MHITMTMTEVLMIFSSVLVLPAIAVLTISFFTGGLRRTEDERWAPVREDDGIDYWSSDFQGSDDGCGGGGERPVDAPTDASALTGGAAA